MRTGERTAQVLYQHYPMCNLHVANSKNVHLLSIWHQKHESPSSSFSQEAKQHRGTEGMVLCLGFVSQRCLQ